MDGKGMRGWWWWKAWRRTQISGGSELQLQLNGERSTRLVAGLIAALTVEYVERVAPVELSASLWLFPILTPILM